MVEDFSQSNQGAYDDRVGTAQPGLAGLFGRLGSAMGQAVGMPQQTSPGLVRATKDSLLDQYEPSLKYLNKFKNKNILITGATGMIASEVINKLCEGGIEAKKIVLFC
jgi:hypothetical protein